MRRTILAFAAILALSSTAIAQDYDYPGPPMWGRGPGDPPLWRRGAPRWQPDRFGPNYQTDENLCINRGDCLDPRRPRVPQFPRGYPGGPPGGYYDDDW